MQINKKLPEWESCYNNFAGLQPATSLKKILRYKYFPVRFGENVLTAAWGMYGSRVQEWLSGGDSKKAVLKKFAISTERTLVLKSIF